MTTEFAAGLMSGGFIIGFVCFFLWLVFREPDYEIGKWANGEYFTTKNAVRIFGFCGERVSNLKYVGWIASLWRTTGRHRRGYYLLIMDELAPPKVRLVSEEEAKNFITRYAEPELASALIRDWFSARQLV